MTDPRDLILKEILPLIPFDGWSEYTLQEAARKAGVGDVILKGTFPGGIADCIDYFFAHINDAVEDALPQTALVQKRIPERIELLILKHLELFAPHREALRCAVSWRVLPWNALRGTKSLYRTVDRMWKHGGDHAIDFSYYTKRATLAALYSSTVLFWLDDHSVDMQDTRGFLKRRLSNIAAFGKKKKALKQRFSA